MPLCFGRVGVGAGQADAPVGALGDRVPHLLAGQLPAAVDPLGLGAQRGEVRAGARLGEQLAPDQLAQQRRLHEPLLLLGGPGLEDRRHRPAGDHDVRTGHAGPGELVVDDDLGHGVGAEAVRRRPVRRQVPVLDHRRPELLGRQRGQPLGLGPHVGADVRVPALEVDVHLAAYAGDGPVREPLGGRVGALDQRPQADRAAQVEVGVVLVGEADPAEDLDARLGVVDSAVEAGHRGDVDGERPLVVPTVVVREGDFRDVPGGGRDRLGGLQHLCAQVLDRLEGADLLTELLAHLGVVDRRLEAPAGQPGGLGGGEGDHGAVDQLRLEPVHGYDAGRSQVDLDRPEAAGQVEPDRR